MVTARAGHACGWYVLDKKNIVLVVGGHSDTGKVIIYYTFNIYKQENIWPKNTRLDTECLIQGL